MTIPVSYPRPFLSPSRPVPPALSVLFLVKLGARFVRRRAFKVIVDDLEVTLREAAAKVVEEPFEQTSRPTDVYKLGNHPAFQGIGGSAADGAGGGEDYDEEKGVEEAEAAAAAAGRKSEAIVVKVYCMNILSHRGQFIYR